MSDAMKTVPNSDKVNTGVDGAKAVADELVKILADTYRMVFKSHAYHWNVEGPLFYSIHHLTEEHYNNLFDAADVIAERIRALGQLAPGQMKAIMESSVVKDEAEMPSAQEMVEDLADDHAQIAKRLHKAIEVAEDHKDPVTADMLTARSAFHETAAWMLRATAK